MFAGSVELREFLRPSPDETQELARLYKLFVKVSGCDVINAAQMARSVCCVPILVNFVFVDVDLGWGGRGGGRSNSKILNTPDFMTFFCFAIPLLMIHSYCSQLQLQLLILYIMTNVFNQCEIQNIDI